MKFVNALVLSLAIAATPAFADSYSKKDVEKYIEDAEAAWTHAAVTGDASVARRILAEDYFGVFPDGSVVNKAEALEALRTVAVSRRSARDRPCALLRRHRGGTGLGNLDHAAGDAARKGQERAIHLA